MKRVLVIDGDLFTGSNVPQRKEQDVTVDGFHVSVRFARVVDVMRAVPAAAAVQTPTAVNVTDAQLCSMRTALSLEIGNAFAGVLSDLAAASKTNRRETASTVDW